MLLELGVERSQDYRRMAHSNWRGVLVIGIASQSSLLSAFSFSLFMKLSWTIVKESWSFADHLDYRLEYSCKETDLLCLNAKLINSEWEFHMGKPITTSTSFISCMWDVINVTSCMVFSEYQQQREKNHPQRHWLACFPLKQPLYCQGKCKPGYHNSSNFPNALLIFSKSK